MSFNVRKILVAVADGAAKKVVDRVAQLAAAANAQVELFSVVRAAPPVFGMSRTGDSQMMRAVVDARRLELEQLAKRLSRVGIAATCVVAADFAVTDAIVRRARDSKVDLVAIEAHKHSYFARLLLTQNDYDLIRQCPVPLLIVKDSPGAAHLPVLAALDPWRANDKPKSLDITIVDAAREVARLSAAPLHSAHVYSPLASYLPYSPFAPVAFPISLSGERKYASTVRRRFKVLNVKYGVPPRNSHLEMGDPAFTLVALAKSLSAKTLVMGAISRSAIQRILIGSTAEKVLVALPCDILIVKPARFRTSVKAGLA